MGLITSSLKSFLSYLMFSSYVSFEFAKEHDHRLIYAFLFFSDILLSVNFEVSNILFSIFKLAIYLSISEYVNHILNANVIYRLMLGNEGKKNIYIPLITFTFVDMWF